MAFTDKATLKRDFRTGEKPTGEKFANLIDSAVSTVNGQQPDANGNVNVSGSEVVVTPPTVNSFYYHPAESEGQLQTVTLRVTDYNPETDALDFYIRGFHMPPGYVRIDSYENDLMTITILEEGRYIQFGSRLEVVKWRYGSTPRLDATVVDNLDSTSRTDAISAYQANFMKNTISNVINGVNQHASDVASDTEFGHVKVDGTTIVSNDGVISAIGGGGTPIEIVDDTQTADSTKALSARAGNSLQDQITLTSSQIITHQTTSASEERFGHVKVDGTTIGINAGVISVIGGNTENLPVATNNTLGMVMSDGLTTSVNRQGVISFVHTPRYVERYVIGSGTLGANEISIEIDAIEAMFGYWFIELDGIRLYKNEDYTFNANTNVVTLKEVSNVERKYKVLKDMTV